MKLYRVEAVMQNGGEKAVSWHGSEADCATARKILVGDFGYKRAEITTEAVDVPVDKKGLLAWLNEYGV